MTKEQKDRWEGELAINRMLDKPNCFVFSTKRNAWGYRVNRKIFRYLDVAKKYLTKEFGFSDHEASSMLNLMNFTGEFTDEHPIDVWIKSDE